jgi:predicted Zn-dependent protease
MSSAECTALAKRVVAMAIGGGESGIGIESWWLGNVRYARNEVTTSGDQRNNAVAVMRNIRGAVGVVRSNQIDDVDLQAAVRRAEHLVNMGQERGGLLFDEHFVASPSEPSQTATPSTGALTAGEEQAALQSLIQTPEVYEKPKIFFDTTYNLDMTRRADVVLPLIESAQKSNVLAAGYIQVSASGRAIINSVGQSMYYPFTEAQFSVTVRDPSGTGSGWAGVDWSDWSRIDTQKLSDIAVDKCLRSRNPVAVEPGRYTVILEPQAVCDLCWVMIDHMDRSYAEAGHGPFATPHGSARFGERIVDERISISADPMDPDLGFPPFSARGAVYHPVTWIDHGVLKELAYTRDYAIAKLGTNNGLPNSKSFRMSGGTTTIDDMIATTKRGLWVTRFSGTHVIDNASLLCTGYTRDGLWLIENGKVSKAVKNFRFTESPMFVLNNVEALGTPQRVFHPGMPVVVPPIKVQDFSFTSLSEAV